MTEPLHSPKGASSAERWMNCPGSSTLLKALNLPETDEPDYRRDGIAAHDAAATCLKGGQDAWELMDGRLFNEVEVSADMAAAIQVYLDHVRPLMEGAGQVLIEKRIGQDPTKRPHPDFYGTVDFACVKRENELEDPATVFVRDYKHGEGIIVEPDTPQLKYYAYGIIMSNYYRDETIVDLGIVQPRAYHDAGPIRNLRMTAGELKKWGEEILIPAMEAAEIDNTFDTGKWCRFCPAKLFCPLLTGLFGAAAKADPKAIPNFSHQRIGLEYKQREAVKFYIGALEAEAARRLNTGQVVPGIKLVLKQAKRVWAADAPPLFAEKFGDEAFEPRELKSPAQMEKINPSAKLLTQEHSYMPNTGYTVADETSTKPAVKVERVEDTFAHLIPDYQQEF